MTKQPYDLVVVGAGPGGYVAAIRAAQLGMNTAIVEKAQLGGTCLNWGCIPTKSLLKSAEVYESLRRAEEFGLSADGIGFDIQKVVKRSRDIAGQLNKGVGYLMKKNRIDVLEGFARLCGDGLIEVSNNDEVTAQLQAPRIILATGAQPRSIPGVEIDGKIVWSARQAMTPEQVPESLLVVGSGAIGMEFASFYSSFGAEVTVLETLDRILPQEDPDISAAAARAFGKRGMTLLTGATLEGLQVSADNATASWLGADSEAKQQTFERVIIAVGVRAKTEKMGLEDLGLTMDRGQVVVDEWCETSVPGVYAIGDMTAPPFLAHKASHEAVVCVEKIAGVPHVEPLDAAGVPACTYTSPQVASVGLTEQQAREQGLEVRVGRFDLAASGKAQAIGETEGFVKTVFDEDSGALLGAHMIGAEVTELIQGYVIARQLETTEAELIETVFAHPTLSEAMHESVLDAYDRVIHA